ncbi:MAG TPA: hypothetical protein VGC56_16580 [Allosphingosinicella sp.]|jgi:hypothetical protein
MNRLAALLLLGAFAATPAVAKSPFDGTWKTDLSTLTMPKKPDVFALRRGRYSCDSCEPSISVWADGAAHPVSGHRYYDHIAVQAVNAGTLRITQYLGDKIVFSEEMTVSRDEKTLSFTFRDMRSRSGPVVGTGSEHRIGRPPHPIEAHRVSGTWKLDWIKHASDMGLIFSFTSEGEKMHMSTPTGQSYDAVIGGPQVDITGDLPGTKAALKRLSETTLQETDTRAGRIVSVVTMTVAPNGRTMTVVTNETVHGGMQTYKAVKQ